MCFFAAEAREEILWKNVHRQQISKTDNSSQIAYIICSCEGKNCWITREISREVVRELFSLAFPVEMHFYFSLVTDHGTNMLCSNCCIIQSIWLDESTWNIRCMISKRDFMHNHVIIRSGSNGRDRPDLGNAKGEMKIIHCRRGLLKVIPLLIEEVYCRRRRGENLLIISSPCKWRRLIVNKLKENNNST